MPPRFTPSELLQKLCDFFNAGGNFRSLVYRHEYRVTDVNKAKRTYDVFLHVGGKTRTIPFDDLYAIYTELYRIGTMERDHLKADRNCERIFGHNRYTHTPGATFFAILPHLDPAIKAVKVDKRTVLIVNDFPET
jgi:hypothetical protein